MYYFKKDKNATEMQKKICALYGEAAVTDQTCQKWFVKFLGIVDILAKEFFAVELAVLRTGRCLAAPLGLYPLEANSGR